MDLSTSFVGVKMNKWLIFYRFVTTFIMLFIGGFYVAVWKFIPNRNDAPSLATSGLIVGVYQLIRIFMWVKDYRNDLKK